MIAQAETGSFEWLCAALIERSTLGELSSQGCPKRRELAVRGTVRLALRSAGLDSRQISRDEMLFVVGKVLPEKLSSCGLKDGDELCQELSTELRAAPITAPAVAAEVPFDSFLRRLSPQ